MIIIRLADNEFATAVPGGKYIKWVAGGEVDGF